MKVRIELNQYMACTQFAVDSLQTSIAYYATREQDDIHKIFNDIVIGKIAEFGVYNYILDHKGLKCSQPDLKVYSNNWKSFDADLHSEGFDVHVKTFSKHQADKYGYSWLFQQRDPLVTNPKDTDVLCLTTVEKFEVNILSFIRASRCTRYFKEPSLAKLKKNKTCLYIEDIVSLPNE